MADQWLRNPSNHFGELEYRSLRFETEVLA